jgi:transcriptional regulator with XRE-family HTH domain
MINDPPESPAEDLAERLRTLRDRSGKTLRELQVVTYASDSALSRYMSGRAIPPWNVVAALCEQTGEDPGALRQLWMRARSTRRLRKAPAHPLRELSAVEDHLVRISNEVKAAITEARARGDHNPEHLLSALRSGADASSRLAAARRLISS